MKFEFSLANRGINSSDHMFVFIVLHISVGDTVCLTAQTESIFGPVWTNTFNPACLINSFTEGLYTLNHHKQTSVQFFRYWMLPSCWYTKNHSWMNKKYFFKVYMEKWPVPTSASHIFFHSAMRGSFQSFSMLSGNPQSLRDSAHPFFKDCGTVAWALGAHGNQLT